jgi:hypothetical protein
VGDEPMSEEVDRTNHLAVESTIRTIGLMLVMASVLALINFGVLASSSRFADMVATQAAAANVDPSPFRIIIFAILLFSSLIVLLLGLGLRALKNWARWIFIVFGILGLFTTIRTLLSPDPGTSPLGMLSILVGSIISIAQICLLFLPGADHVCSKHYQFVISTTPEIRPTPGLRDKILLGAFAVNAVLGLLGVAL